MVHRTRLVLLALLAALLVCTSPWFALASTENADEPTPALRLEVLEDGTVVFLSHEGDVVGWIPEGTAVENVDESLAAAPPQLEGWPVSIGEVDPTPTVADVDGNGGFDVVVKSRNRRLYVLNADGSVHPGWPQVLELSTGSTPALVDSSEDGTLEIFVGDYLRLVAFGHDGTLLTGWPQPATEGFRTVGIEDLDSDGTWEIVATDKGHLFVWDTSGVLRPGWPFTFPQSIDHSLKGPALGDVDGDGFGEIVIGLFSDPSLYVFTRHGSVLAGFPLSLPVGLPAGVSMGDADGDGRRELWIQAIPEAMVVSSGGMPLAGWPVPAIPGNSAPALADLDGDGFLEMVWGTIGGDATVYAFHHDGSLVPGWPITVPQFSFNAQATVGDVDGDGSPDIVLGGFTATFGLRGRIYAWHGDGTPVEGFPFDVPEGKAVANSAVTIADVDQDGDVELIVGTVTGFGGTSSGRVFAFDLPAAYNPTTMEWPTLGHDVRNTSRYEPPQRLAAHAGFDLEVQCTTLGGEIVTLDGSHSADKDSTPGTNDDIVSFEWFEYFGSPSETFLGNGETLDVALGLGSHEITLRVTDSTGNQDTDSVRIAIVDTEAPEILVSHSVLWPPNHRMASVTAEVQDCSASSFTLVSVESNEPDDAPGLGDGNTTGDIQGVMPGTADLAFELRAERDGTGQGRTYSLIYETEDALGNAATRTVEVLVPHDLGGLTEPLTLELSQATPGTLVAWTGVTGATSYDVVRGEVGSIKDLNGAYHLGSLTCIAAATTQTSTAGLEDADQPALGEAFFYLAAYDDGSWSGYGTESAAKERFVPPGLDGCR